MTNVNAGHRARMRKRMMTEGVDNFQDHEILEVLLYQSLPRQDTNKIAHDLLLTFGSFANVFDASPKQLTTVKGISTVTACNLSILKEVWKRYQISSYEKKPLSSIGDIIKYTQYILANTHEEKLVVAYLDQSNHLIVKEEYTSRNPVRVDVDVKKLVSTALTADAHGLMLFHCHVDSPCDPSPDDRDFTRKVFNAFANLNIVLLEHIIFNNSGQYYSFFKEKDLERLTIEYNQQNNK